MSASAIQFDTLLAGKQRIEDQLESLLPPPLVSAPPVSKAMRYAVFGGGQRLRPLLSLRVAEMLGAASPLSLRAAAAVELLHCASLIVDDLPCMDNDPFRRGRPSVHIAFGEANALLAAFGLVALAARSVVDLHCHPRELSRLLDFQVRLLSTLDCDCMIAGQSLDLSLHDVEREAHRVRLAALKTVPLFELAVRAGTLFARVSSAEERSLAAFGRDLGVAYQMRDDFADGEIHAVASAGERFDRARACLTPFGRRAVPLLDLLDRFDVERDRRNR